MLPVSKKDLGESSLLFHQTPKCPCLLELPRERRKNQTRLYCTLLKVADEQLDALVCLAVKSPRPAAFSFPLSQSGFCGSQNESPAQRQLIRR